MNPEQEDESHHRDQVEGNQESDRDDDDDDGDEEMDQDQDRDEEQKQEGDDNNDNNHEETGPQTTEEEIPGSGGAPPPRLPSPPIPKPVDSPAVQAVSRPKPTYKLKFTMHGTYPVSTSWLRRLLTITDIASDF